MKYQGKNKIGTNDGIRLQVLNADNQQNVVYSGQAATLSVTLTNNTGTDIGLVAGNSPSSLKIFLPEFYQLGDVQNMQIDLIGWKGSVDTDGTLMLTCQTTGSWAKDDSIIFKIAQAQSSTPPPAGDSVRIRLSQMGSSNLPAEVESDKVLSLEKKPDHRNAKLDKVLELELSNQHTIYISENSNQLLSNNLSLNIKNASGKPLYSDSAWPPGTNPQVLVYFVYGNEAGDLAPDDPNTKSQASAWSIKPGSINSEGNQWTFSADDSKSVSKPQWWLKPQSTSPAILGIGKAANITFEFTDIVSLTPEGHTQMYVQFSDFPGYNDHLFTLDINKEPLPQPGLIDFSTDVSKVTVHSETQEISIPLQWLMTGVSKIELGFSIDSLPPFQPRNYPVTQSIVQGDNYLLKFSGITETVNLTITCTAFNDGDRELNDKQQTINLHFPPTVTKYQGDIQPDGSLLLNWTTGGATKVGLPQITPDILSANGKNDLKSPVFPLLNNPYYTLIANNDQQDGSGPPCVFNGILAFGVTNELKSKNKERLNSTVVKAMVSPNGAYLFITNFDYPDLFIFENVPPFNFLQSIRVGGSSSPMVLLVSADSKYVLVSHDDHLISTIDITDPSNFKILDPITVGQGATQLLFPHNSQYAFVVNSSDSFISVLDMSTMPPKVLSTEINYTAQTGGIAASADGKYIFASDNNSVVVIENAPPLWYITKALIDTNSYPTQVMVSPDGNYIFVIYPDRDNHSSVVINVFKTDYPNYTFCHTIQAGKYASGIVISADSNYLFIANGSDNVVTVVDIKDDFKVLKVAVGKLPWKITISPDGNFLFVSLFSGAVCILHNSPPFTVLQTIKIKGNPSDIVFSPDSNYAYVLNDDTGVPIAVIAPTSVQLVNLEHIKTS